MRRNFFRSFLAAAVISVFFSVSAYAESAVVVGNRVNLRAGPGTGYYVIATLDSGTTVEVIDRSNGAWYAVQYAGYTGFISSSYLGLQDNYQLIPEYSFIVPSLDYSQISPVAPVVPVTPTAAPVVPVVPTVPTPVPTAAPVTGGSTDESQAGYINAMYVRFRSGPSSDYSILGTYSTGKTLTILGAADGWTACVIDGQLGYVYSQYVSTGSYGGASSGGITVIPGQSTSSLPQPNGSGITVINPVSTPVPTQAPVVYATPVPTLAPVVVVTPVPTQAPVLPSPSVPAPVTTPSAGPSGAQRANLAAYIAGSYVRFRSGPGTNYSILGTYNTGKAVTVQSKAGNGWLLATIDGVDGYVSENYVLIVSQSSFGSSSGSSTSASTQQGANGTLNNTPTVIQPVVTPSPTPNTSSGKTAYITGNNVRFRVEPSMNARVIDELFYGNAVTLHAVQADWALVTYGGQTGYVYAQYVKEGSYAAVTPGQSSSGSTSSGSSAGSVSSATGQEIANFALQYVGSPYRWGGSSPSTGFDCSGLVYYVYKQFGYTLNRVAQDQASNGVHVEPSAIQPGDILCFYSGSSYIGHVGIYIGGGRFVHASNSTTGVIISELSGYYSSRGYEARRIVA